MAPRLSAAAPDDPLPAVATRLTVAQVGDGQEREADADRRQAVRRSGQQVADGACRAHPGQHRSEVQGPCAGAPHEVLGQQHDTGAQEDERPDEVDARHEPRQDQVATKSQEPDAGPGGQARVGQELLEVPAGGTGRGFVGRPRLEGRGRWWLGWRRLVWWRRGRWRRGRSVSRRTPPGDRQCRPPPRPRVAAHPAVRSGRGSPTEREATHRDPPHQTRSGDHRTCPIGGRSSRGRPGGLPFGLAGGNASERSRNGCAQTYRGSPGPMDRYRLAVIEGDGIGREVVPEGLDAIRAAGRGHRLVRHRDGRLPVVVRVLRDARPDDGRRRARPDAGQRRHLPGRHRLPGCPRPRVAVEHAAAAPPGVRPVGEPAADAAAARASRDRCATGRPTRSTWSSCARTPRASTAASAAGSARARRMRS